MAEQGFDISKYITAADIVSAVTAGIVAYIRNKPKVDKKKPQPQQPQEPTAPAAEPAPSANDYVDNVKDQISYMTKNPRKMMFSHGNINGLPPTKIPLTGVGGRMAGNVIYGDLENLADEAGLFDGTFADANDVANALVAFGAKKGMNLNTLLNMMKHMPDKTFSALAQNIDSGTADDFLSNCFTQWHAAAGSSLVL